ncbi:hypothetical protein BCON_0007g00430 [Botryotinia convoluta]|uniref:Tc1-like transposase DDE domain-containing protein n=1 Tax=Botryotinia convoluta TaxID=54673 RepID=A0A4Z1J5J5_9HELO|nr:hypothetical protein BCON_0007g00430 [Botryotinia convoluta]
MTQKYYVKNLLPIYVDATEKMREIEDRPWLLQEDSDPSHGMRKAKFSQAYKGTYNVKTLRHPAQSPNINTIGGIWVVIKQRIDKKIFHSEGDMEEALKAEWDKITMAEI